MFSQYGLCHHDVGRRPLEAVEEAGDGHRVYQALPCAHDAHIYSVSLPVRTASCSRESLRMGVQKCSMSSISVCRELYLASTRSDPPLHHKDMINMIKLTFMPKACCWVHRRGQAQGILAAYTPPSYCRGKMLTKTRCSGRNRLLGLFDCTMVVGMEIHWRRWKSCIDFLFI